MKLLPFLVLTLPLLAACSSDIQPGRTPGSLPPVTGLEVLTLQTSSETGATLFTGSIGSTDRAEVAARSSGRITQLQVREGDRVAAGQSLLKITDNPATENLQAASAALAAAEGSLATAKSRQLLAEKTETRYRQLKDHAAVSPQEYDQVASELEMARSGVATAAAAVEQARAQQAAARQQQGYNSVNAPVSGKIARVLVEQGTTVAPGMPLLVIDRAGGRQVIGRLPDDLADQLQMGEPFRVELPALGRTVSGVLSRIQPSSDPASRSFEIRIDLVNEEDLPTGLFARFSRSKDTRQLLLVPSSAVVTRGQLTGVYLVDDGLLRFRLVRLGRQLGDRLEILAGLNAGDSLVVAGVERAVNGARVEN